MADHLSSGQIQTQLGVSRPRLRDWESKGIISPIRIQRNTRIWREYPPEEVERVKGILTLLERGLTLQGALRYLPVFMSKQGLASNTDDAKAVSAATPSL